MKTLSEYIAYAKKLMPCSYDNDTFTQWINEVEGYVQSHTLLIAKDDMVEYDYDTDSNAELLVEAPYNKIYYTYLFSMICFANGEYNKYNNTISLYNTYLSEFTRWYASAYAPANGEAIDNGYYLSAYSIAVKHGYTGTETEWLASLKGDTGVGISDITIETQESGEQYIVVTYDDDTTNTIETDIKGDKGDTGATGATGDKGDTGYYYTPSVSGSGDLSWTNNGTLSNPETVNIKGATGATGATGDTGVSIDSVEIYNVGDNEYVKSLKINFDDNTSDSLTDNIRGNYIYYYDSAYVDQNPPRGDYLLQGDLCVDVYRNDIYSYNGEGWDIIGNIKGATGATGTNGREGSIIYSGSGEPTLESYYISSDYYIDTSTYDLYYFQVIEEVGVREWQLIGNIKGTTGDTGAIEKGITLPEPSEDNRGMLFTLLNTTGADKIYVCLSDSGIDYKWMEISKHRKEIYNIIPNGNFENTNYWSSSFSVANNIATVVDVTRLYTDVDVVAGNKYYASAWLKLPAGDQFFYAVSFKGVGNVEYGFFDGTDDWQRIEISGTCIVGDKYEPDPPGTEDTVNFGIYSESDMSFEIRDVVIVDMTADGIETYSDAQMRDLTESWFDMAEIEADRAEWEADRAEREADRAEREADDAEESKGFAATSETAATRAMADLLAMLGSDIATLTDGKLTPSQIPALSINDVFEVDSVEEMLQLTAERGDVALVLLEDNIHDNYILAADDPALQDNWKKLGISYVANAGHASTADNAVNADKINNKRMVAMTQNQYDTAVIEPNTIYIVTPDGV